MEIQQEDNGKRRFFLLMKTEKSCRNDLRLVWEDKIIIDHTEVSEKLRKRHRKTIGIKL